MSIRSLNNHDVSIIRTFNGEKKIKSMDVAIGRVMQTALQTQATSYSHPLEFVTNRIPSFLSYLSLKDLATISCINRRMPSCFTSLAKMTRESYLTNPVQIFTMESHEFLFLVNFGGLPLLIQILTNYFKQIAKKDIEKTLIRHFKNSIDTDCPVITYALFIFARQKNIPFLESEIGPVKDNMLYYYKLRQLNDLLDAKSSSFIESVFIMINRSLHDGNIQKAERGFALVKILETENLLTTPWETSWKWIFRAFIGLTYEKMDLLEKALLFAYDNQLMEVDIIRALANGLTQIIARGSIFVDQPKWLLEFINSKGLLSNEEISEAIEKTILHWLHHGNSFYQTDEIAQKVFDFAKKNQIALPKLGSSIGQNMWKWGSYSQFSKFIQENEIEIPHYWHHAAFQLIPGLKWLLGQPEENTRWNYNDSD